VREIDLGTDAVLMDIDTPEALARLRGRHRRVAAAPPTQLRTTASLPSLIWACTTLAPVISHL
jgi:hypothetical protein